jgi:signal transduction histidine kinase
MLLAIMSLDGIVAQYIWPNQGLLAASAVRFFMVLAFTFALLFATSYLQTKESMPRLHKIMISLAIASIVFLGLQYIWFRGTAVIHVLLMLASIISLIIAGLIAWQRGYKPARYFLFGWAIILLGFTIFVLTLVDVVPLTLITDSILRIGLVVLALVLSIGLSERIDIYRQEKEAAQMATIAQRTRIAQDLHDSVTQSLYSANLFAEAGMEVLEAKNVQGVNHYLERIISTTQQALKEMRLFLYELRPPDVVEDGLVDALQKRLDTVEKRAGMEANLLIDGPLNFPDPVSDQFYRISQEALNNVLKHAQADEVTVYLQANNGMMELEVKDDGLGFDLSEAHKKGGLGLRNMQERASQMNGEFTIKTAPNQGTIVKVKVMKSNE